MRVSNTRTTVSIDSSSAHARDHRDSAKEINEQADADEWRIPEQAVDSRRGQQRIGGHEDRPGNHETERARRHGSAKNINFGEHSGPPALAREPASYQNGTTP